jgi:transcriptional regulator with XRE-family HTH domain
MERIKRMRMVFCKYLYAIAKEKNFTIEDIVRKTNKSYTEVKRILEGLVSPSFDDLLLIADLLGVQVTLDTDISLAHKKVGMAFAGGPFGIRGGSGISLWPGVS